jgi:spermidine/putrescine transport system substrate-binding protein
MTELPEEGITRRTLLRYGAGAGAAAAMLGLGRAPGAQAALRATDASAQLVTPKADGDMTWFNYEGYVNPKVLKAFENRYGVKVNLAYFANDDSMLKKVASGQPYDLITTTSVVNRVMIAAGLLRGFDPSKLKNFDQIIPYFRDPPYDNGSVRYSIPYGYGPAGIAYQKGQVKVTGSWNDLWTNASDAKGKIYVLDDQAETLGMSLIRDHVGCNSGSTAAVTKATANLISLKPSLGGISSNYPTIITSNEALIAHVWAGSVYQSLSQEKTKTDWNFEWPREGLSMGSDTLSVGAHAKSPGTALLFMQYLLEPQNSYDNTSYTGYSNGTTEGEAAYRHLTKAYPFLALPDANLKTAQWRESPTGSRLTLWNSEWNRFVA